MNGREDMDRLFKRMAEQYVQKDGADLLAEHKRMQDANAYSVTPGLDGKVKAMKTRVDRAKRNRWTGIVGIAAAVLIAAVILPSVYRSSVKPAYDFDMAAQDTTAEEAPAAEEAAPEAAQEAAQPDEAQADAGGSAHDVIPLSQALPDNFSVSAVEQDVAKTIYYLDNTERDDVVLTLEYTSLPDLDDFSETEINGKTVYYKYKPEFSVMTFEQDGIVYEMSCEHDIQTLEQLSEALIET